MPTNFPANLDAYPTVINNVDDIMASHMNNPNDAIEALEAKIGINGSSVTNSLDYILKNTSAGHNHDGSNSTLLATFKTGDLLLSSVTTARSNWTNKSSTYSNVFIRINATPNTTSTGATSHTHGVGSFTIASSHTHGPGSYAGPNHSHSGSTGGPSANYGCQGGGGSLARNDHTHSYTSGGGGNGTLTGSSASGGTGSITGTSASGNHIPAYVTCASFQRN